MKRGNLILYAGLLLLLFGGGAVAYTMTRGLRNNNPGNIRHGDAWQGMSASQNDPDFVTFESSLWGIRALMKVLLSYAGRGLNSVRDVISRWAPSSENDTQSYVDAVASSLNVSPDTTLNLNEPVTLIALAKAITKHENGLNPYSDADFSRAYAVI